MTCTRNFFFGTYQKTLVCNCLPIQNARYSGTVVQKMLVPGAASLNFDTHNNCARTAQCNVQQLTGAFSSRENSFTSLSFFPLSLRIQ